ncbi:MAG: Protein of unknown function (DUF1351) [Bacteriophage sp.]|nr:MAG: Protein of unknown function (DUF1351) [Bacteriophage sp.]
MDEKMEIRLVNPTEDGFLQRIDWNKAELEENVRSIVAAYQGLVYTEDTVSDAKNDRAALRKLLNEIEDRRKLVKKKCMEPYEVFESDLKDVTALIKEQISIIDGQVKEYENSVKEEKKARLQDVYAEAIGELAEVLPFERVFEAQYLNVSFKESKAATEIREKVQRVKSDLAAIDALDSKYKLNAKDIYVRTLDMSKAMAENARLIKFEEQMEADRKRKAEEEERRRAEAEERRRQEAERIAAERAKREKALVEQQTKEERTSESGYDTPVPDKTADAQSEEPAEKPAEKEVLPEEKKYKATFYAIGTLQQLKDLQEYMKEHNIQFGKAGK